MLVQARVCFPVDVEIEIADNSNKDDLQDIEEALKLEASINFENSTIIPIITSCSISELEE